MQIRNIKEADFLDCVNIVKKSWPEFKERESIYHLFSKYFSNTSFVVEQNFQVVSFLLGFLSQVDSSTAYIHLTSTDPDVEITEAVDRSGREIVEGTGSRTPIPYIRITFEATDAVGIDSTECSLDGGAFTSCTSPVVCNRLSRGIHEVIVRATDEAGNTGEDQFTWTVGSPPSNIGGSKNR